MVRADNRSEEVSSIAAGYLENGGESKSIRTILTISIDKFHNLVLRTKLPN